MRSYLRKLTLIAALAAPLAALAADAASTTKPAADPNPCGLPCCGPTGQRAQGPQAPVGDKLNELGGSFLSP